MNWVSIPDEYIRNNDNYCSSKWMIWNDSSVYGLVGIVYVRAYAIIRCPLGFTITKACIIEVLSIKSAVIRMK